MLWALAVRGYVHKPLFNAIAASARAPIVMQMPKTTRSPTAFNPQSLATTAWSLAQCQFVDLPLRQAISAASIAMITQFKPAELGMTFWAFSRLDSLRLTWVMFDSLRNTTSMVHTWPVAIGAILTRCEAQPEEKCKSEVYLLLQLACRSVGLQGALACNAAAVRAAEAGWAVEATKLLSTGPLKRGNGLNTLSAPTWRACGGQVPGGTAADDLEAGGEFRWG
mmetsp:Transcript_56027/g.130494  ORF Transcript_56027/g.130494 Transcript_56027/m.130494 type:complete len:223 (+) Transcript_56027:180-848(+)